MSLSRCTWKRCIVIWCLKWMSTRSLSPKATARSSPTKDTFGAPFASGLSCVQFAISSLPLIRTSFKQPMESCDRIQPWSSRSTGMSFLTRVLASIAGSVLAFRIPSRSAMMSWGPLDGPSKATKKKDLFLTCFSRPNAHPLGFVSVAGTHTSKGSSTFGLKLSSACCDGHRLTEDIGYSFAGQTSSSNSTWMLSPTMSRTIALYHVDDPGVFWTST
mmetsp:Transcript_105509/g.293785  ORF Transcript_105509/g.293785 Transcript_105509/m.293785 type:complete len:217 (-) Transcript_105509:111-761(-)